MSKSKLKVLLTAALAASLAVCSIVSVHAGSWGTGPDIQNDGTYEPSHYEQKYSFDFSKVNLEDGKWSNKFVRVYLINSVSLKTLEHEYTAADFPDVDVKSIYQNDWYYSQTNEHYFDNVNSSYQTPLIIELKTAGWDNIKSAVTALESMDMVSKAYPAEIGVTDSLNVFDDVPNETTKGDVTLDGKADSTDALEILKISVGVYTPATPIAEIGDMNYDGVLNSLDALIVLRNLVA